MTLTEFIYALDNNTWFRRLLVLNLSFFVSLPIIVLSFHPIDLLLNKFGLYFSPCGLGRLDSTFHLFCFMSWTMNWLCDMWKFGARTTFIVSAWDETVVYAIHASVTADLDVKYREHRIMPNEVLRSESYRTVHKLTFGMTVEQVFDRPVHST
jgi:cytochrome c oxidase subunit IV